MTTVSVPAELPAEPPVDPPVDAAVAGMPFRDPGLPLRERVEDLLSRLTAAERVAMLHQYVPAVPRLGMGAFRTGTETLHGVGWLGEATVFPQSVGLGATWDDELLREVGVATSTELRAFHHHRAPAIGEGRISLQAWAPVVNLLRDPRWGRNEEGYSEDPLLSAQLGHAFCRGMSGDDPARLRTAPILKHFLAYNNEDERTTTSSGLRPRVLHEYDLAAFRQAVSEGSATGVMVAYNLVNGRPCHVSPLIEDELRRWAVPTGRELFVVSDAEAPSNLVQDEHYFDDHPESHGAALRAGIDSFTDHADDSSVTVARIGEALERGLIGFEDVDRAVRRQLEIRFRLGEFDPERSPYADTPWSVVDSPEHRALARRAATEAVVLLKNSPSVLPVPAAGQRVAVVGPLAGSLFEDWYAGTMPYRVTVADGLTEAVGAAGGSADVVEGVDRIALRTSGGGLLAVVGEGERLGVLSGGAAAVNDAESAGEAAQFDLFDWDLGVLTLRNVRTGRYAGLVDEDASLVADRVQPGGWDVHETFRFEPVGDTGAVVLRVVYGGHYAAVDPQTGAVTMTAERPEDAEQFIVEVVRDGVAAAVATAAQADSVVVVLGNDPHINGRETQDRAGITLPPAQERLLREVAAACPRTVLVVMSSYPYAVDWADANVPAVLWTSHAGQETGHALADVLLGAADPAGRLPQTWYRADDPLPARLDYDVIKAGWTYQYHEAAPLYAFGHGLSYTSFTLEELALSSAQVGQAGRFTASVTVTNSGTREGTETVQVYVRALAASTYEAPRLRLAAYRKVRLAPGERARVDFELAAGEVLAHWSVRDGGFAVEPGAYEVLVGRSAADLPLAASVEVTGEAPAPRPALGRALAAVDFDDHEGAELVDATRAAGDAVQAPDGPATVTLVYREVDLTGASTLAAEVSRTAPGDASIEVRAGGALLATLAVPSTGGRYAWTTAATALAGLPEGVHDVTLTLCGEQRLRSFTFTG